jgi:hypothetical protein
MDRSQCSALQDAAFFVALLATALALGGALAHALELPNKIGMVASTTLAVQLFGILAVIWLYHAEPRVWWPATAALASLVAAQAVFRNWTFPTRPPGVAAPELGNRSAALGVFQHVTCRPVAEPAQDRQIDQERSRSKRSSETSVP